MTPAQLGSGDSVASAGRTEVPAGQARCSTRLIERMSAIQSQAEELNQKKNAVFSQTCAKIGGTLRPQQDGVVCEWKGGEAATDDPQWNNYKQIDSDLQKLLASGNDLEKQAEAAAAQSNQAMQNLTAAEALGQALSGLSAGTDLDAVLADVRAAAATTRSGRGRSAPRLSSCRTTRSMSMRSVRHNIDYAP